MEKWFKVLNLAPQNLAGETVHRAQISLRGYIGETNQDYVSEWTGNTYEADGCGTVKELEEEILELGEVGEIELLVSSEGGDVFAALVIADILNRNPARIVATVEGYAFSAASVLIAKCADEIRMASNAFMMIHNASTYASGSAGDFQKVINMLTKTDTTISEIYASRGGGTAEEFRALMDAETYLTGTECAARKLADTITDEVVLTNYKPLHNPRNLAKMPENLRVVFDKAASSPANTSSNPSSIPDMTPVEVQALIDKSTAPLVEANTKLTADLVAANKIIESFDAKVENATKPLIEANTKLTTEMEDLRKLKGNGVLEAANAGGAPITGAGGNPTGEQTLDLKNMTAEQLVAEGRKKLFTAQASAAK